MKFKGKALFLSFVLLFSGCSIKTTEVVVNNTIVNNTIVINDEESKIEKIFAKKAEALNVSSDTLKAICNVESKNNPYAVNVNQTKDAKASLVGSHSFQIEEEADLFMNVLLDPKKLNYDIGYCQINSQHLKANNLENVDLLDVEKNIDMAAKIFKENVEYCEMRGIKPTLNCALSMYNTGKSHNKSKVGAAYAQKVIKAKKDAKTKAN